MTYHASKKRKKLWSEQANAKQARLRRAHAELAPVVEIDPHIKISIERTGIEEHAIFECFEGDRIDNYRVYCNGKYQGVQSITTITKNIRKALPAFKRMD